MALVALVAAGTGAPRSVDAQLMASEAASMTQTIDGTHISMEFSRPTTRGRSPLFGGPVFWGKRWTPGANQATTLEVDKDVRVDGHEVPRGIYSVWMDVTEETPWTLILDPRSDRFHLNPPKDADEGLIRVPVEPRHDGAFMDALLWYFATVRPDGGELRMHWGTTIVSLDLTVPSSVRIAATAEEANPVEGHWTGSWLSPDGSPGSPLEVIVQRDPATGVIVARDPAGESPQHGSMIFLPVSDLVFQLGWGLEGALWETMPILVEFERGPDGKAVAFQGRDEEDKVVVRGERSGDDLPG